MKIALLDLNHTTRGIHTNTVPLGLGMISKYLRKTIDYKFDIKIFKDTRKALSDLYSWHPDILGIAQYVWNSELNMHVAKIIKKRNPDCLAIAGGPNLELDEQRKLYFLKEHSFIDICVSYDGEIPFAEIIRRLLKGENIKELRDNPAAGTYSLNHNKNRLVENGTLYPRIDNLDVFGPIYSDGSLDELMDQGFHPFLQTHRGCPFRCAFCHTSDTYYSKMLFQSPEVFGKDMEYLGKRFSGKHNVVLYMANTNMSLFSQDFEIAKIIRKIQERYDWPKIISVNSGKKPQGLLDMLSIIEFQPAIALQTLTPKVLDTIERINIPFDQFVDFQRQVTQKTKRVSTTELILCLPKETKKSFMKTLATVINSEIQNIVIYTLMNLKGTPLYLQKNRDKYGFVIKHRVVPGQFSEINGKKVIDSEEVVVATNSMSFKDYLELRGLSFVVKIFFSSAELLPLKKFLKEYNVNIAQWVFNIHKNLPRSKDVYKKYLAYIEETKKELFPSRESLLKFFNKEENWDALRSGKLGQNLLRKYMKEVIYESYESYLKLALKEAEKLIMVSKKVKDKDATKHALKELERYLYTRNVKQVLENNGFPERSSFVLQYDIPNWFESNNGSLFNKRGLYSYSVELTKDSKKWVKNFYKLNKDTDLSLQNLYHQGGIENLWPEWTPQTQIKLEEKI